MRELTGALVAVYSGLSDAALHANPAALKAPNPFLPARDALPTVGDFAAYLMTGHLGHHLGQLLTWRAAAGLRRSG
jgi:hypothetical protein